MENFKRNAVGITLLILIAVAIIAVVVIVAVDANKPKVDNEYFIDTAPIDYGSAENVIYVKRFRDTVGDYFGSQSINLSGFADRLLNALSAARIPAIKLDKLATAIKNNDLSRLSDAINNGQVTKEMLEEIFSKTSFVILGSFFRSFYRESGLTSEEFSAFIYNYLDIYESSEYKSALHAVGKEQFTDLIGYSTYFLSIADDMNDGGLFADDDIMASALYQLGAVLVKSADGGAANLEKVLGFEWIYASDNENYAKINAYTAQIKNNLGYVLPMAGYVLKEIDVNTLKILRATDYSDDAERIYAKTAAVKAAIGGIEKFIADFGSEYGAENVNEVFARLQLICVNLYGAIVEESDGDRDSYAELTARTAEHFKDFSAAVQLLGGNDRSLEELKAMTDENEFGKLKEAANAVDVMSQDADTALSGILYMWITYRAYEAVGEE